MCGGTLYYKTLAALVVRGKYVKAMQLLAHTVAVLEVPSLLEDRPLVVPEGPLAPETQVLPKKKDG